MAEISQWRSLIKIDDLSMKAEKGGVSFVMLCRMVLGTPPHFIFNRVIPAWLNLHFFRIASHYYCSTHCSISTVIDTAAPRLF